MGSRRKRKRYRRLTQAQGTQASRRGDRPETQGTTPDTPIPSGGWGEIVELWSDASRGDLVLLRHAVRENWPIPVERRPPIIEALGNLIGNADARRVIGIARVFLAMDRVNLEAEREEMQRDATDRMSLGPNDRIVDEANH